MPKFGTTPVLLLTLDDHALPPKYPPQPERQQNKPQEVQAVANRQQVGHDEEVVRDAAEPAHLRSRRSSRGGVLRGRLKRHAQAREVLQSRRDGRLRSIVHNLNDEVVVPPQVREAVPVKEHAHGGEQRDERGAHAKVQAPVRPPARGEHPTQGEERRGKLSSDEPRKRELEE